MDTLKLLRWLLSLKDKLPAALVILERIMGHAQAIGKEGQAIGAAVSELVALIADAAGISLKQEQAAELLASVTGEGVARTTRAYEPTAEVEALENAIAAEANAVCEAGTYAGRERWDGSRIRTLVEWLQNHPLVISIIGLLL